MNKDDDWAFHMRMLSQSARDAHDPSNDADLLQSVNKLYQLCKAENSSDLVARIYPQINKLFQRCISSTPSPRPSTGLLLLEILQFFLDFGEATLHDADPSIRAFFRSCLSRQFTDLAVAKETFRVLINNKAKLSTSFPYLLQQYFPLLLKLIAWNAKMLHKDFLKLLPVIISPGSCLPMFSSLLDLPALLLAIERREYRSGSSKGSTAPSIQKSQAPENLLQLMDEAYTGSTIDDQGADSEEENAGSRDDADALFLDLLKDENDGIVARHWISPGVTAGLQAAMGSSASERLIEVLKISPTLLEAYFKITLRDMNDSVICALIPIVMARNDALFPEKTFSFEVRKRILEFILSAFQRSPHFIVLLKKPIMDRIGEAYDSPAKSELALQLCWGIGEYGAGGISHKDAARELFESLELLLYENISSRNREGPTFKKAAQSRFLCFVVTAIAKIATCHQELIPRARVCLAKVACSKYNLDKTVITRASDYLGLMSEPPICLSILGLPSADQNRPGVVHWNDGDRKAVAHIPFYIIGEKEGPPFYDYSLTDILGKP